MKTPLALAAALLFTLPVHAQQSWTGRISDSMCKAKHEEAAEGQGRMADRDCTLSCVKGGSRFVLIAGDKVLQIANQDQKDLAAFAGRQVTVTGDLKGDTLTVAKIDAAKN
jgi:hypothetical protein